MVCTYIWILKDYSEFFVKWNALLFKEGQNSSSDFWPSNYQVAKKQVLDFLKCLNRHILSIRMLHKNNLELTNFSEIKCFDGKTKDISFSIKCFVKLMYFHDLRIFFCQKKVICSKILQIPHCVFHTLYRLQGSNAQQTVYNEAQRHDVKLNGKGKSFLSFQ